jgi:hypothetical protein
VLLETAWQESAPGNSLISRDDWQLALIPALPNDDALAAGRLFGPTDDPLNNSH